MSFPTRAFLILMMMIAIPASLYAQEPSTTAAATATEAAETSDAATETVATEDDEEIQESAARALTSYEVRDELSRILQQSPPEVSRVLRLDPTLLSNEPYLSGYPALAQYIEQHPEILRSPRFYLGEAREEREYNPAGEVLEAAAIFLTFTGIALVLAWLVRTVIEQRRWNRLSRQQSEVHNKILDRFGSTEELLSYMKTPAGSKFLESAPIPLHVDRGPVRQGGMPRVLLSIQIGVVVGAIGLGLIAVGGILGGGSGNELFALGIIGLFLGGGFVASAAVSIFLTKKLGLLGNDGNPVPDPQ